MKHSNTAGRGYLVIDHSASPGLTAEECARAGRPLDAAGTTRFESDVIGCGHCPLLLIVNPGSGILEDIAGLPSNVPIMLANPHRTRARGWCPHCSRYLCDGCDVKYRADSMCRDIKRVVDNIQEQAFKDMNLKEHCVVYSPDIVSPLPFEGKSEVLAPTESVPQQPIKEPTTHG